MTLLDIDELIAELLRELSGADIVIDQPFQIVVVKQRIRCVNRFAGGLVDNDTRIE